MPLLSVPAGVADLTAEWLTAALWEHSDGAVVRSVVANPIGLGNVAESVRLVPDWDRPTCGPASLIAKVPSSSEESRAAGFATRTYELEVAFYRELARTVSVNAPYCYLARFDAESAGYVVLLEDLAPAEAGDQIVGVRDGDAVAAISELAALHAPRWGDASLLDLEWLDRPQSLSAGATAALAGSLFEGFVARYRDRLLPGVLDVTERLMSVLDRYLASRPGPWALAHGDYRVDNLLFGGPRVAVVDWQTIRIGPPVADLSYFIGSAMPPEARAGCERDLVASYHDAVTRAGIDLTWEDCWESYRKYAFDGLVMGVVASMLVTRSERADEMFMAMVNRHGRQALDLGSLSLVA